MITMDFIVRTGLAGKPHLLLIVFSRVISIEASLFLIVTTAFFSETNNYSAIFCSFIFAFHYVSYFSSLIKPTVFYESDVIFILAQFSVVFQNKVNIIFMFCFEYHVFLKLF